jgi:hypothetical protein
VNVPVGIEVRLSSCIPTGTHGPTCIFWADLTPFALQRLTADAAALSNDEFGVYSHGP